MSEQVERKFSEWYERMNVQLLASIQGEQGFRYDIGMREEVDGAVYIYVAKVVPSGIYAKSVLRMPKKVAVEVAKKILELVK